MINKYIVFILEVFLQNRDLEPLTKLLVCSDQLWLFKKKKKKNPNRATL